MIRGAAATRISYLITIEWPQQATFQLHSLFYVEKTMKSQSDKECNILIYHVKITSSNKFRFWFKYIFLKKRLKRRHCGIPSRRYGKLSTFVKMRFLGLFRHKGIKNDNFYALNQLEKHCWHEGLENLTIRPATSMSAFRTR